MCIYKLSEYATKAVNYDSLVLSSIFHNDLYKAYMNGEIDDDEYERLLDETD